MDIGCSGRLLTALGREPEPITPEKDPFGCWSIRIPEFRQALKWAGEQRWQAVSRENINARLGQFQALE